MASSYLVYKNSFRLQTISEKGKASYTLGQDVAKNFMRQGISIEEHSFYRGFLDGLDNSNDLNEEELRMANLWAQNQAKNKLAELHKLRDEKLKNELHKNYRKLGNDQRKSKRNQLYSELNLKDLNPKFQRPLEKNQLQKARPSNGDRVELRK
jgi:hypothetical protein